MTRDRDLLIAFCVWLDAGCLRANDSHRNKRHAGLVDAFLASRRDPEPCPAPLLAPLAAALAVEAAWDRYMRLSCDPDADPVDATTAVLDAARLFVNARRASRPPYAPPAAPTDAEVEAALWWLTGVEGPHPMPTGHPCATLRTALDALVERPALVARCEAAELDEADAARKVARIVARMYPENPREDR